MQYKRQIFVMSVCAAAALIIALYEQNRPTSQPINGKCPEGTQLVSTKSARPAGVEWKWMVGEPWPEEYCR